MKTITKQTERTQRDLSIVRGNVGLTSIKQAQTSMALYGDAESMPMSMPELSKWLEREVIKLRFNRKMEVTKEEYEFILHELFARGFTYAQALRAELNLQLRDVPFAGRIPILTLPWFYPTDEMLKGIYQALNAEGMVLMTKAQYQARLKAVYEQGQQDERKRQYENNRPDSSTLALLELKAQNLGYMTTIDDLQGQVTRKDRELRHLRHVLASHEEEYPDDTQPVSNAIPNESAAIASFVP